MYTVKNSADAISLNKKYEFECFDAFVTRLRPEHEEQLYNMLLWRIISSRNVAHYMHALMIIVLYTVIILYCLRLREFESFRHYIPRVFIYFEFSINTILFLYTVVFYTYIFVYAFNYILFDLYINKILYIYFTRLTAVWFILW